MTLYYQTVLLSLFISLKGQYIEQMIKKHTRQLLQHGYTTTVVLYPFKDISTVTYSHIMGSDLKAIRQQSISTGCIIHEGKILEEFTDGMRMRRTDNYYFSQKYKKVEGEEEEVLIVYNYMTELYELYKKGNKRSEHEEKIRILLRKSFSEALSRAVMGEEKDNSGILNKEKVDDIHYIIVVPNDWMDEIAESILRPIFIDAGLINRDDPPCRLIFVDTLSAIFYSFQKHLFDPDKKQWLKYGTIKKNKHYALFDVDFDSRSNAASIACHLFQTGNTNSTVNGFEVFQPHNVSFSCSGKINLVSAYTIENNLLGLLYNKKILPVPISPSPEILTGVSKKKDYDRKIDRLLKKMIQIAFAYYMNSKSDNNGVLKNEDGKSSTSQMPLQRPFRNLDFGDYIKLTKPQSKALEEVNMKELYDILFRENESRIKKYTEDCLKEYRQTLQEAVLAKTDSSYADHFYLMNRPYISAQSEEIDDEYKKHADQDYYPKITVTPAKLFQLMEKDNYYIKLVSHIICSCTETYFNSTATEILEKKLQFFEYSEHALVKDLLLKIQDDIRNSLNFLPPSIILFPKSRYNSMLESTEKAHPKCIVNIDMSLQSCSYSYVQIDKGSMKEAGDNKTEALDLPSLNSFIETRLLLDGVYSIASLHISQEMLNLLESAQFQAAMVFFAEKYDRKAITSRVYNVNDGFLDRKFRPSKHLSTLREKLRRLKSSRHLAALKYLGKKFSSILNNNRQAFQEEFCDEEFVEEDTNYSTLDFLLPEEEILLLPTIEKLFQKHDDASEKKKLIIVQRPSYIMTFLVVYLIYVKNIIDANLTKRGKGVSGETSYVVSVEEILLDKYLMGSKSIMKELLIASGITNKLMIRKHLRVITQGECSFPIMQEKAKLDLPLKSYYVHTQLYESSIQLTLNQVVKKEPNPMTIAVKSDIIPMKHMHKLLCDNLWNQIQSHCHKRVCERHRVDKNENLEEEREYSMVDRLEFEESFMQYVKNLPSLKESTDFEGLKMPKGGSSCSCSVYLTHTDIIELAIKPVLKTIVSSILSTLTNDQIFGEYYISALFVTFDFILNSVFHHSYKDLLKSILENTSKTRSEVKGLGISYFIFLESDYAKMAETRNCTLSNLFSEGSLSQVSSATYLLRLNNRNKIGSSHLDIKVYTKDPKTLKLNQVAANNGSSTLITILERGDQLSFKEGGIKKKFYLHFPEERELRKKEKEFEEKIRERERGGERVNESLFNPIFFTDLLRFDPKLSRDNTDVEFDSSSKDYDISTVFSFYELLDLNNYYYKRDPEVRYMSLYINIKPLGYRSLIEMSFEYGHTFYGDDAFTPELIKMGEQLTLKNTQYVPQVKVEED